MSITILHLDGPLKGHEQHFDDSVDEILFGRSPECQVVYPPEYSIVGRMHVLLRHMRSGECVIELLAERYKGETFVRVPAVNEQAVLENGYLNATALNGTNLIELFVYGTRDQLLLTARLDNLGKGASGAAVQNLNLMLGLPETTGLGA